MNVKRTCSLVTMEGALMGMIGVMAIMTVEITVMKIDVSGERRGIFFARPIIEQHLVYH